MKCLICGGVTFNCIHKGTRDILLFTSATLEKLLLRKNYKTKVNTHIQRYPLANHLYWLSKGKPGGHVKWPEFNEEKLAEAYMKRLIDQCMTDTLWYIGKKNKIMEAEDA